MTRARELADSADKDFAGTVTVDNIVVDTDLQFATGATVTTILDEDAMGSDSATALSTQQAIKAYVDTQVATVPTGDITEVTAGTGLTGGGTTGAVTLNIDSTVATLTGTQTLTNKSIDATQLTGTLANAVFPAVLPAVSGANLTNLPAAGIAAVVDDTTPQLGGNLDTNGNDITFGDNDKAVFGSGSDLQIWHDTSNSNIRDVGTGFLGLDTNGSDVRLTSGSNAKVMGYFQKDGPVYLYNNGNLKLATTSTGIDITGTATMDGLSLGDAQAANFGASNDLRIYHDGSNSFINDVGTGNLRIGADTNVSITNSTNSTNYAVFNDGSAVKLYYGGNKKFETTATGVSVTGTVAATSFTGDGSSLTGISAGATGGGSDQIFYENGQTVTSNYTITNGKNAMSAGPITINTGVTVTVGTGETWTVV